MQAECQLTRRSENQGAFLSTKIPVLGATILSNGKKHLGPTDRNDQTGQKWTTFKAGPEYSCLTKPKWFVPSDVSTEIPGISILGWMESAPPPPPFLARFFWNGCCSLEQSWAGQPSEVPSGGDTGCYENW